MSHPAGSPSDPVGTEARRPLRMLFFLDYLDAAGTRFPNSPGLLPFIGFARSRGFEIDFVPTQAELFELAADPEVDVIGISSMERLLPRSIPVARRLRELRPDCVLMIGGNSIGGFAVELAAGLFDIVVVGEADHLLPAILSALAHSRGRQVPPPPEYAFTLPSRPRRRAAADPGGALTAACVQSLLTATFPRRAASGDWAAIGISNVYVRDPGTETVWHLEPPSADLALPDSVDVNPAPRDEELDDLCVMPWDLVKKEGWKNLELYAQRGCRWGRCNFCSVRDSDIRAISPEKTVSIIAEAARRQVEAVSFADNLFIQQPEWNRKVLDGLIAKGLQVPLRAQTRAARTVWPFLASMRRAGFECLSFGLETVDPARATFMVKSLNGRAYVEQARETITRTAEAGIYPVFYLIMADPRSTLLGIVREVSDVIDLMAYVYRRTRIVPKPSYSLAMLPIDGTQIAAEFPFATCAESLGQRDLILPTMFHYPPDVIDFFNRMGKQTADLPWRCENLAAFPAYLDSALATARDHGLADAAEIELRAGLAASHLAELTEALDRDLEATLDDAAGRLAAAEPLDPFAIDYRRFGGYISGVSRLGQGLAEALRRAPQKVQATH
jgi:radical SAM superfamily enzyme YgiQ (UPF0313 family)